MARYIKQTDGSWQNSETGERITSGQLWALKQSRSETGPQPMLHKPASGGQEGYRAFPQMGSFGNAFLKAPAQILGDIAGEFNPDLNRYYQAELESNYPSSGASGFVGGALGSIVPTAAAVLTAPEAAIPYILGGVYGASGVGQARTETAQKRSEGEQISPGTEAMTALGYGAVQGGLEAVTGGLYKRMLEPADEAVRAASTMGQKVLNWSRTAGTEAVQEGTEQVATNAIAQLGIDPSRSTWEGVPESMGGGFIGGGAMHGLVRLAQHYAQDEDAKDEDIRNQVQDVTSTLEDYIDAGFTREQAINKLQDFAPAEIIGELYDEMANADQLIGQYGQTTQPQGGAEFSPRVFGREGNAAYYEGEGDLRPAQYNPMSAIEQERVASQEWQGMTPYQKSQWALGLNYGQEQMPVAAGELGARVKPGQEQPMVGPFQFTPNKVSPSVTEQRLTPEQTMKQAASLAAEEARNAEKSKLRGDTPAQSLAVELMTDEDTILDFRNKGMTDEQIRSELGPMLHVGLQDRGVTLGQTGNELVEVDGKLVRNPQPEASQVTQATVLKEPKPEPTLRTLETSQETVPIYQSNSLRTIDLSQGNIETQVVSEESGTVPLERQRQLGDVVVQSGIVDGVYFYDRPAIVDRSDSKHGGKWIGGFVDHDNNTIHVFRGAKLNTIGHEATHRLVKELGLDDPVVSQGLDLVEGETPEQKYENLMDAVGDVFARRNMDQGVFSKILNWIRNVWARAKERFGASLTLDQVGEVLSHQIETYSKSKKKAPGELEQKYPGISNYAGVLSVDPRGRDLEFQTVVDRWEERERQNKNRPKPERYDSMNFDTTVDNDRDRGVLRAAMEELRRLRGAPRKRTTDAAEEAKADKWLDANGLEGIADLLRRAPKGDIQPFEVIVLRDVVQTAFEQMKARIKGMENQDEVEKILGEYKGIFEPYAQSANYAGKLLRYYKTLGKSFRMHDLYAKWDLTPQMWARIEGMDLSNYRDILRMVQMLKKPTWGDLWKSVYINSLLSNPKTPVLNAAINKTILAAAIPERGLTGFYDWLVSKVSDAYGGTRERRFYASEMKAMIDALKPGWNVGWEHAQKVWKTGQLDEDLAMAYDMHTTLIDAFDRHENPTVREIGKYITWPTKILGATDAMDKAIGFAFEAMAGAEREGRQQGLEGKELANYKSEMFKAVMSHSSDPVAQKLNRQAGKQASKWTFTAKAGPATKAITGLRDSFPGGWMALPFVTTLANIFKVGVAHTPGVGLLANLNAIERDAILNDPLASEVEKTEAAKKDSVTFSEVMAQQTMGLIGAGLFGFLFGDDDRTIGEIPSDPREKAAFLAAGKRPFSVRFGDRFVSFNQLDPFSVPLRMLVTIRDWIKDPKNQEDEKGMMDRMYDLSWAVGSVIGDNSFLSVFGEVSSQTAIESRLARIPASFVPLSNFWRGVKFSMMDLQQGGRPVPERESLGQQMANEFANVIPMPGLTPKMLEAPTRLNVWGEPIVVPGAVWDRWLPISVTKLRQDSTEREMERLEKYVGLPDKNLQYRNQQIAIPSDLWREYAMVYGSKTKEALDRIIASPGYRSIENDVAKLRMLDRSMSRARESLRPRLLLEMRRRGLIQ